MLPSDAIPHRLRSKIDPTKSCDGMSVTKIRIGKDRGNYTSDGIAPDFPAKQLLSLQALLVPELDPIGTLPYDEADVLDHPCFVLRLEFVVRYEIRLAKGTPERKRIEEEPLDSCIGDFYAGISPEILSVGIESCAWLFEVQSKENEGRQLAES